MAGRRSATPTPRGVLTGNDETWRWSGIPCEKSLDNPPSSLPDAFDSALVLPALLADVAEVVWIAKVADRSLQCLSPTAAAVYGRSFAELCSEPRLLFTSIHPEDQACFAEAAQAAQRTGRANTEFRIVRPDQDVRNLRGTIRQLGQLDNQTSYWLGIFLDVTAPEASDLSVSAAEQAGSAWTSPRNRSVLERAADDMQLIIGAETNEDELLLLQEFTAGVLAQLSSILQLDKSASGVQASAFVATRERGKYHLLSSVGRYAGRAGTPLREIMSANDYCVFLEMAKEGGSHFGRDCYLGHFRTRTGRESVIYLACDKELNPLEMDLIRFFVGNIGSEFDNTYLNHEILNTQKEVLETRSRDTANHTVRVGEFSYLLGKLAGLSGGEARLLQLASPMHDVGKIGIPDAILNKPGQLTPQEFEFMKSHTLLGYDILRKSKRKIMQAAAIIALQHHEQWDGRGYPQGLCGEEIHTYGRIVCLADTFDALSARRIYRPATGWDEITRIFESEHGRQFDPGLCDLFLTHQDEFIATSEDNHVGSAPGLPLFR